VRCCAIYPNIESEDDREGPDDVSEDETEWQRQVAAHGTDAKCLNVRFAAALGV
jgi:hypothetical protein